MDLRSKKIVFAGQQVWSVFLYQLLRTNSADSSRFSQTKPGFANLRRSSSLINPSFYKTASEPMHSKLVTYLYHYAFVFLQLINPSVQPAPRLLLCPQQEGGGFVAVHHRTAVSPSVQLLQLWLGRPVVPQQKMNSGEAEVVYLHDVFFTGMRRMVSVPSP